MYRSTAIAAAAAVLAPGSQAQNATGYTNYTTVLGYFLQDVSTTNATTFDYTATNFGLINRTYPATSGLTSNLTQWQAFEAQVNALNADAPLNTAYKVLFMGRHGEGYHNAEQSYVGTPAWNCYYSLINGNETAEWFDADLTPNGIDQALIAHNFWLHEIATQKIPYPQSYYSSPLTRCLKTANYTFAGIETPEYYPFVPTIKELLREGISIHTCDHRRTKTYIHDLFPTWNIEPGFTECDEKWNGVTAETSDAQDARSKRVLDDIFGSDDHTWISITSHSGEIASILRVLGHQSFSLNTGAVIPVLVKAEFVPSGPAPSNPPYTTSTHCAAPPVTSISSLGQGCVCSGTAVGGITTPIYDVPSAYPMNATFQATDIPSSCAAAASGSAPITSNGFQTRASDDSGPRHHRQHHHQSELDDPYGQVVWPGSTIKSRTAGSYACLPQSLFAEGAWFMKAIDTETDEVVAYTQWTLPTPLWQRLKQEHLLPAPTDAEKQQYNRENEASLASPGWPKGMRREVVEACGPAMSRARARAFMQSEYIMLDQVKTLPAHQRRGAGTVLVQWGVVLADREGLTMCLEATPFGLGLYKKFGFETKAEVLHDLKLFDGSPDGYKHTLMVRQPCRT